MPNNARAADARSLGVPLSRINDVNFGKRARAIGLEWPRARSNAVLLDTYRRVGAPLFGRLITS
jgi:hypothetical protein